MCDACGCGDSRLVPVELHERLLADNSSLRSQVTELRRVVKVLEADLAASRQAHAEDVASLAEAGATVRPLGVRP